jgi:hypothetical protein
MLPKAVSNADALSILNGRKTMNQINEALEQAHHLVRILSNASEEGQLALQTGVWDATTDGLNLAANRVQDLVSAIDIARMAVAVQVDTAY